MKTLIIQIFSVCKFWMNFESMKNYCYLRTSDVRCTKTDYQVKSIQFVSGFQILYFCGKIFYYI